MIKSYLFVNQLYIIILIIKKNMYTLCTITNVNENNVYICKKLKLC